jgi:hypothetical protein
MLEMPEKVFANSPMPPEPAFGLRDGDGGGDFAGCTPGIEEKETGRDDRAADRGSEGGSLVSCSSAFLVVLEKGRRHRNGSLQAGASSEMIN